MKGTLIIKNSELMLEWKTSIGKRRSELLSFCLVSYASNYGFHLMFTDFYPWSFVTNHPDQMNIFTIFRITGSSVHVI